MKKYKINLNNFGTGFILSKISTAPDRDNFLKIFNKIKIFLTF